LHKKEGRLAAGRQLKMDYIKLSRLIGQRIDPDQEEIDNDFDFETSEEDEDDDDFGE
jgi:hypothetical protein